jgi:hypothetical protein
MLCGEFTMPVELAFEKDGAGVVIRGSGVVNAKEILHGNEQVYASHRIDKLRYQLCDYRDVTEFDVSSDDLRAIARQDKLASVQNPDLAIAIIGDHDVIFGMGRMWEAFVSEAPIKGKVFRTIEEARAWLGIPEERAPGEKAPHGKTSEGGA